MLLFKTLVGTWAFLFINACQSKYGVPLFLIVIITFSFQPMVLYQHDVFLKWDIQKMMVLLDLHLRYRFSRTLNRGLPHLTTAITLNNIYYGLWYTNNIIGVNSSKK